MGASKIDVGGGHEELHSLDRGSPYSVYGRELADGSSALMVLNTGDSELTVRVHMEDVGDSMQLVFKVRDLWRRADEPVARDVLPLQVPAHGVRLVRLTPQLSHALVQV